MIYTENFLKRNNLSDNLFRINNFNIPHEHNNSKLLKRLFDLLASSVGLLLVSPLLLLIALLIKLDSRGPVFFRQKRIGWNKKAFYVFKFRSMTHRDPDTIDHRSEKVLTGNEDLRIPRIGRILRITSLDELPQLLNILTGDMSLVGPRPIIPEQLEVVPYWFNDRFNVRPGITGLAQVKGRRSLSWEQQLVYDNEYARNHSFMGDIKILFLTVWVVVAQKGIYGDESKNWRAYKGLKDEEWESFSEKVGGGEIGRLGDGEMGRLGDGEVG